MNRVLNKVYQQSATTLADIIKKPIVDVIVTSPPYADLKNYGVEGQIGYGQDYENEYLPSLKNVFQQCFRISKPTASLWIVVDTFKKNREVKVLPFDIARICKECGWVLTDIVIWEKGKTLPWSHRGQLRNLFEYILFFTKSKSHKYYVDRIKDPIELKEWWVKYPERYSFGGKNPSNLWRIPIPVQGSWAPNGLRHFCPFPPELVERILLLTTDRGDVVLDPFAGSGVVLAQSLCMNRRYIGFEINPSYVLGFKKTVLPAMQAKWSETQKEMLKIERRRREFESKIQILRILKYPKSLIKALQQVSSALAQKVGVILVEKTARSKARFTKFARIEVTLVLDNADGTEKLKKHLDVIKSRPPLSKFGLDAQVRIRLAVECMPDIAHRMNHSIYIYRGGRTHYYDDETTVRAISDKLAWNNWRSMWKNGVPPIVSSLGVRQEIERTWRPPSIEKGDLN